MFERYTDRARRVIVIAQEQARLLNHGYVGTEHILLGLAGEDGGVAHQVLAKMGVTLDTAREQVELAVGKGQQVQLGHIQFTPRTKRILELSLREALQLGHNYVATEHLLLGILREGEGLGVQVLVKMGCEPAEVRKAVLETLHGYAEAEKARAEPRPAPLPVTYARRPDPAAVLTACTAVAERLSDLDEYIGRRASEIAAEAITESQVECDKEVEAAKAETVRQQDLVAELRRHIAALERQVNREGGTDG